MRAAILDQPTATATARGSTATEATSLEPTTAVSIVAATTATTAVITAEGKEAQRN